MFNQQSPVGETGQRIITSEGIGLALGFFADPHFGLKLGPAQAGIYNRCEAPDNRHENELVELIMLMPFGEVMKPLEQFQPNRRDRDQCRNDSYDERIEPNAQPGLEPAF